MRPGCTTAQRFGKSSSRIRFIRFIATITPPAGPLPPPLRPAPEPPGTPGPLSPPPKRPPAAASSEALLDLPGLARVQKLRDIACSTRGDGLLLLVDQDLLVGRLLLAGEHAERDRILGREELRQDQRRRRVRLVVDPHPIGGDVRG